MSLSQWQRADLENKIFWTFKTLGSQQLRYCSPEALLVEMLLLLRTGWIVFHRRWMADDTANQDTQPCNSQKKGRLRR